MQGIVSITVKNLSGLFFVFGVFFTEPGRVFLHC